MYFYSEESESHTSFATPKKYWNHIHHMNLISLFVSILQPYSLNGEQFNNHDMIILYQIQFLLIKTKVL